jgi:hypothetical protein
VIALLFFIAGKMALTSWHHAVGPTGLHISPTMSLGIVLGTLALGVVASLLVPRNGKHEVERSDDDDRGEGDEPRPSAEARLPRTQAARVRENTK